MAETTFSRLQAVDREQSEPLRARYVELMLAAARNEQVDAHELGSIRAELSIDEATLRKHVHLAAEISRFDEQLERAAAEKAELDELRPQIERLQRERREFLEQWESRFRPLADRREFLSSKHLAHGLAAERRRECLEAITQ